MIHAKHDVKLATDHGEVAIDAELQAAIETICGAAAVVHLEPAQLVSYLTNNGLPEFPECPYCKAIESTE